MDLSSICPPTFAVFRETNTFSPNSCRKMKSSTLLLALGTSSLSVLLNIYRSLIFPYMSYGLAAWVQAAKTHLQKLLVLQKRVLRLMYFREPRAHAVPLFITSNILPINMLYVETVSSLMYDVSRLSVPSNISDLFTKVNEIRRHKTRSSSLDNFYIKSSSLSLNQRSFARFGAKLWNSYQDKFRQLPKSAFKKLVHGLLLSILEAEDNYVEAPILLHKIANFS